MCFVRNAVIAIANKRQNVFRSNQRTIIIAAVILVFVVAGGLASWQLGRSIRPTDPQILAGTERINPIDGATMVWVPAGTFIMGDKQHTHRRFFLDSYWIYKTEVTVAQYRQFSRSTGYPMPAEPRWGWIDDHPITGVRWEDAFAYARWAKAMLPTIAQWEKAARGTDGRIYPWGNDWDAGKLQCSTSTEPLKLRDKTKLGEADRTAPVGSFPAGASPYGCLDMAGNVAEWCADWYDDFYFRQAAYRNPIARPATSDEMAYRSRVARGGSWYTRRHPDAFLVYKFGGVSFNNPSLPYEVFGFRCVVNPKEHAEAD